MPKRNHSLSPRPNQMHDYRLPYTLSDPSHFAQTVNCFPFGSNLPRPRPFVWRAAPPLVFHGNTNHLSYSGDPRCHGPSDWMPPWNHPRQQSPTSSPQAQHTMRPVSFNMQSPRRNRPFASFPQSPRQHNSNAADTPKSPPSSSATIQSIRDELRHAMLPAATQVMSHIRQVEEETSRNKALTNSYLVQSRTALDRLNKSLAELLSTRCQVPSQFTRTPSSQAPKVPPPSVQSKPSPISSTTSVQAKISPEDDVIDLTDEPFEIEKPAIVTVPLPVCSPAKTAKTLLPAILSAERVSNGLTLHWNIPSLLSVPSFHPSMVKGYEIYSYNTTDTLIQKEYTWKLVDVVNPYPLPMKCTMSNIQKKSTYHFALRSLDFTNKTGPWSNICSIDIAL